MINLEAVLYREHTATGEDTFELWQLDIPQEAKDAIEAILMNYLDRGTSVNGTAQQIAKEIETL